MTPHNGPTSAPDYWISLTGDTRPARRINTPRHHGPARPGSHSLLPAGTLSSVGPARPGFRIRTFPTTAPITCHRKSQDSPPPAFPFPARRRPTSRFNNLNLASRRPDREDCPRGTPAGGHESNNITRKQLHVGWSRARGEGGGINGLQVGTLPVEILAAYLCLTVRQHAERDCGFISDAMLYEVSSGSLLFWALSFSLISQFFFCVHHEVSGRHRRSLPVGIFTIKARTETRKERSLQIFQTAPKNRRSDRVKMYQKKEKIS